MILDADYAAIESRIVCWVAGQEDALEEFRQGVDRYKRMASLIYSIPEKDVNKFPQRFVGKSAILGAGYGMGPRVFRSSCLKVGKYELPDGLEFTAIESWRAAHPQIPKLWKGLEKAAKQAIVRKGQVTSYLKIKFRCRDIEGMPFLLMRLPSGRKIAYPRPRIVPHSRFEGNTEIVYFGHQKGVQWGDVRIWGGTFCENICQGIAGDILCHGVANAENAGYEIMSLIHDQALAYYKPGQSPEEFVRLLTDLPAWADGLPIAAEGGLVPFYKKD